MKALLDFDIYCYRNASSAENEDLPIAIYRLEEAIDKTLEAVQATEFSGFLTGPNNFRYTIFPEYKAGRTQPKPRHLQALREYLIEKYSAVVTDGYEADDALGIEQCKGKYLSEFEHVTPTIICGLDKDLLQIPGNHYSFEIRGVSSKGGPWVREERFTNMTEWEGLKFFYTQVLTGDSTDGIKGAAGIGKVKAERLLQDCTTEQELFDVVRSQFSCDEELLMNARCIYIWRKHNDDWMETFNLLKGEE